MVVYIGEKKIFIFGGIMDKDKYYDMFEYVENLLSKYDLQSGSAKNKINYNRMEHTKRVYKWMLKLYHEYDDKDLIDIDSLKIATIFHDSGYGHIERCDHALMGAKICRKYLSEHNYPIEKIDFICDLIQNHSNKESLMDDIPAELILLMESDLLDDTGAHGIVMDVWVSALSDNPTFESILEHIEKFTYNIMQDNPMRTPAGKRIWNEKLKITNEFYYAYKNDLCN